MGKKAKALTWKETNDIKIIPNLKEETQDIKSLKKAIREYNFTKINLLLSTLDNNLIEYFFTYSIQTTSQSGEYGWLKTMSIMVHRLTKNMTPDGSNEYSKNKYNSETFKLILQKLLTIMNKEILIKNFLERHSFSEQVREDFHAVIREYDEDFTSSEEESLDNNDFEEDLVSNSEAKESDNNEQNTDYGLKHHENASSNSKENSLNSIEFNENYNNNIEVYSLVKEYKNTKDNTDDSIESLLTIDGFIAWIYSLPENIQEYFLSTESTQELITSLKAMHNIINSQNIIEKFSQLFEVSLEKLHKSTWKHNDKTFLTHEIEFINQEKDISLIDTSVMFEGDMSGMMIVFPTIIQESINMGSIYNSMNHNMVGEIMFDGMPLIF